MLKTDSDVALSSRRRHQQRSFRCTVLNHRFGRWDTGAIVDGEHGLGHSHFWNRSSLNVRASRHDGNCGINFWVCSWFCYIRFQSNWKRSGLACKRASVRYIVSSEVVHTFWLRFGPHLCTYSHWCCCRSMDCNRIALFIMWIVTEPSNLLPITRELIT